MTELNLEYVRQQFPSFYEPSLTNTAFFENAGGSYMCRQVMDRFDEYFRCNKVQPYYPNRVSSRAGEMMDESYGALAPWLGVDAETVYFGPSTSQNTYVLANALMEWLKPGDEIIVTNQDHEANSGVWRRLSDRGVVVHEWRVDPHNGQLDLAELEKLFTPRSKLLAFPHCSNILGQINPVSRICGLAREQGVRTVVDGVSYAGHGLPNVDELQCDIYLFSLYKVYGPHLGVMVIRPDMAELLGNQGHFFNSNERVKRLYPAGPDHAQVAAAAGVGGYFADLYKYHFGEGASENTVQRSRALRNLLHTAERKQLKKLLDFLSQHTEIHVIGPEGLENRAPTVSLLVRKRDPLSLVTQLGDDGIICGGGHFYSWRLLDAMGLNPEQGVLRFSLVHYTSDEDTNRLIGALDKVLAEAPV